MFRLFAKKDDRIVYDPEQQTPVVRSSICTGEKVAGLLESRTGKFTEIAMIRSRADLEDFCRRAGVSTDSIRTIY